MSAVESDAPLVDVQTEDSALIMFRTANDIAGSAVISQLSAGRKNRLWIEVDGMHQSAVFDQELGEQLWIGGEAGVQLLVRDPNHGSAEQRRLSMLPAGHTQGYAQCFENYVADSYAAVDAHGGTGQVPEGLPTFADGARAAEICDAMLRSAASGEWVSVGLTDTATHGRNLHPPSRSRGPWPLRDRWQGSVPGTVGVGRLPVPNGFHITTAAYHDFVAENHLEDPIKARLITVSDPASQPTDQAASGIAALIIGRRSRPRWRLTSWTPTSGWVHRR